MALPLASQRWAVVLGVGMIVCVIVLIATTNGYTLSLRSFVLDLDMRPASTSQAPPPR